MIINDNTITSKYIAAYSCECGKSYKYASGLSRHKNNCSFNSENKQTETNMENTIIHSQDNKERLFLELMSKNNDLMEMLQEQNKTIQELVPKIGNNNNNNNTTNNNQFNLQVFLHP